MSKQPHLLISPGQIATKVLICGEPDRVNRIAEQWLDNIELVAENREYRIINGTYQGQAVTICSTGIGALQPSLPSKNSIIVALKALFEWALLARYKPISAWAS
ncbi:phosphorylase family protein [Shewanella marina]|uniref:phosphorylase family protein n=1 Tax=Shewanella marina TaxID=487319 RepID=UPI000AB19BFA|nr:hypothetical protein [Shewanella marina]